MVSSGIRVGAWDYLHWGNIRPVQQNGKIVAARMVVYAGEEEDSYLAFITPSAYRGCEMDEVQRGIRGNNNR